MSYSQTYRKLFGLKVMHAYFLDSGETEFADLGPGEQKSILERYAYDRFLHVVPTAATARIMESQRMVLRSDNTGISIGVQIMPVTNSVQPQIPFIGLSEDLVLEFLVKIADPAFANYTDLALSRNRIFFFGNHQPTGIAAVTAIPVEGAEVRIGNGFKLSELDTERVLKKLGVAERTGLFGLVSLKMKGQSSAIQNGAILSPAQSYELSFPNRNTTWRYRFSDSRYFAETKEELPLTRNGYIQLDAADLDLKHQDPEMSPDDYDFDLGDIFYPSPDARRVEKDLLGNYYSVIFI